MQPPSRRIQFAHFLNHTVSELHFRLVEILQTCEASQKDFTQGAPRVKDQGPLINYQFSAFSSLVQTIKDVLPVITNMDVTWSSFSDIRHMQFMQAVRNAVTHDGNPVINGWIDGRFYVICDFVRLDRKGNPVQVVVPTEDIATVVIQFADDLCTCLSDMISYQRGDRSLRGALYGAEFFDEAINHPAVPEFAQRLYAESERAAVETNESDPIEHALNKLDVLQIYLRRVEADGLSHA